MVSQTELVDVPPWRDDHCIGGHSALDFINTESHRLQPALSLDRFNTIEKIASWLVYQGLISKRQSDSIRRQFRQGQSKQPFIDTLATLRSHCGEIFDAIAAGETIPTGSLTHVLRVAGDGKISLTLISTKPMLPSQFSLSETTPNSIPALLALLILDALFRLPHQRIRSCPRCGWVFFDHSKGGRRKWCDMKSCGNREKVSRHYYSKRTLEYN